MPADEAEVLKPSSELSLTEAEQFVETEIDAFMDQFNDRLIERLKHWSGAGDYRLIGLAIAVLLLDTFEHRMISRFPRLASWRGAPSVIYQAGTGGSITLKNP